MAAIVELQAADADLVVALIRERRRLKRELAQLTDWAIAGKFDVSVCAVRRLARQLPQRRRGGKGAA